MAKNRRAQTTKPIITGRNGRFNEAMMEKGRSSAASRHRMVTDYKRKPKHSSKGWDY